MAPRFRSCRGGLPSLLLLVVFPAFAQTQGTAALREVRADGGKLLTEAQVVALTGLVTGTPVGQSDLQAGADNLVKTGLFAHVNFNFRTRADGVAVTFHVEESPRVPAYFDNIPWFSDSELGEAIRKRLPFFDGTLPEGGTAVDQATEAVSDLLSSRNLQVSVQHQLIANPLGEGNVQEIRLEGAALKIAKVEFGDISLSASKAVQQHLSEILGKPYSRMTIDLFLSEAIKPIYLQHGYLRAKLGPPEVRLTGNPNQKLPEQIPVYVPIATGEVFHWKTFHWTGHTLLSEFTLNSLLGAKPGDIADGMQIEAGWDRIREEYSHRGYLDAKLDPVAAYDDHSHTVSYSVKILEGAQYHFAKMILTGLSLAAERKLREAWPIAAGDIFDKAKFEEILTKLQNHQEQIFGELPLHYDSVGHWLQTDAASATVDVLLDFK